MKRVAASLYLSFLDQSVKNDEPGARRSLRCAAAAAGGAGSVPARGEFILRLEGTDAGSSVPWRSGTLTRPIDERGQAVFDDVAILDLAEEAAEEGARADRFFLEFDGTGSKRVTRITIDCVHQRLVG